MLSKINLVSSEYTCENVRDIKSKINDILTENGVRSFGRARDFYIILIYAKYIIEKNNLNAIEIINGKFSEDNISGEVSKLYSFLEQKDIPSLNEFFKLGIYKLLKDIIFEDYYISSYSDRVLEQYIKPDKKYLFVEDGVSRYTHYPNVDVYYHYRRGMVSVRIKMNNLIDEILDVKKNYYTYEDINIDEYDEIIVAFILPSTRYEKKMMDILNKFEGKDIFIITNYKNVSNIKMNSTLLLSRIHKMIIDRSAAYVNYRNYLSHSDAMIIQKITDLEDSKIMDVIDSEEEIKDLSIIVPYDKIRDNNRRIGFSIYNKEEVSSDEKLIADIVDENDKIWERIKRLGDTISAQIDKMNFK